MRAALTMTALLTGSVLWAGQATPPPLLDAAARAAYLEPHLAPRDGPGVAPPAAGADRTTQRAFEAAQLHAKGLAFAAQGAWREAEAAFHDAERRNDKVPEYVFAAAYAYLRTHKPQEAYKRYESFYKKDPSDRRALLGMIAAREEAQFYRDAVQLWQRYARLPHAPAEAAEIDGLLRGARELFAQRYEIAENPAGGAANLASPQQELEWGLGYAKELSESGVPLLTDRAAVDYVTQLTERLVAHAKQFPTNYRLYVLDTAVVNATTVPGFIFVYRGLLDAAPSEAALAGVLAHEIGHSVAHHTAKKVTKAYTDEQQLASLKQSDNKLSRFLAKLLEAGNPVGALTFSRDAEAQADRLAVHIMFDAGFTPDGLAEMFQVFEQMAPSSRSGWDLMTRTHPFSIDRVHAVREYAAFLPPRPLVSSTPAFDAVKTRLKALAPAPDATGRLIRDTPAAAPQTQAAQPAPAAMPTKAYAMTPTPFTTRIPETWTARKPSAQTTVFAAPAGTPDAEASVWIRLAPAAANPTWSITDYVTDVQRANAKLTDLTWSDADLQQTPDGRRIVILPAQWTGKTSAGSASPYRAVFIFAEFPDYMAIGQYSAPAPYFQRLSGGFDVIWNSLTYGAAAPAPTPAPAPAPRGAAGTTTFTVPTPPYTGEMPADWVSRQEENGVTIIEGRPGTEAYEMTIRIAFYDRAKASLEGLMAEMRTLLRGLPGARVTDTDMTETQAGRPAKAVFAEYTGQNVANVATPLAQVLSVVEYERHFVVLGYAGPAALFDKYLPVFQQVGTTLRSREPED